MAWKKKQFVQQLKDKSVNELVAMIKEYGKDLFMLKMKNAIRALKQPHLIRQKRKDLARVHTALSAKKSESNGNHSK